MLAKLRSHVRHNVVAYLALFFALTGTAAAAGQIMREGDPAGGDLTGTYPNPGVVSSIARDSDVFPIVLAGDGSGSGLDADKLDNRNSTDFLGASAKAADADRLDGKDSTDFARLGGRVDQDGTVEQGSGFTVTKSTTEAAAYRVDFPGGTFRFSECHVPNATVTPVAGGPDRRLRSLPCPDLQSQRHAARHQLHLHCELERVAGDPALRSECQG